MFCGWDICVEVHAPEIRLFPERRLPLMGCFVGIVIAKKECSPVGKVEFWQLL